MTSPCHLKLHYPTLSPNLTSADFGQIVRITRFNNLNSVLFPISGMLYDEEIIAQIDSNPPPAWSLATLLDALPSYKTLLNLVPEYNF